MDPETMAMTTTARRLGDIRWATSPGRACVAPTHRPCGPGHPNRQQAATAHGAAGAGRVASRVEKAASGSAGRAAGAATAASGSLRTEGSQDWTRRCASVCRMNGRNKLHVAPLWTLTYVQHCV
jgi:hypothetical protein